MNYNNQKIAKNTLFIYFRMFVTMTVSLYTSRVVLRTLGVEDYGLYNVIGGIIAIFGFIKGAMTNTTYRFITVSLANDDLTKQKEIFNLASFIHLVIALLIFIAGETIGLWYLNIKLVVPDGRMFAAQWLYQLTIVTAVLNILYVPYNAVIIAHEKMNAFAYISIIDVFLKLIIAILLAFSPFDKLIFYGSFLALVSCFDLSIYFFYCRRKFNETKLHFYWIFDKFKKLISFAGWGAIGNFSYVFYTQGLNLLLNFFCGPAVNAARGISVQVDGVIRQFANNVQTAINPQIIKSYASSDFQRMYSLIYSSSRICFYLLYFISLPLMLETQFVLELWLGEGAVPAHTVNFVRIILAISLFDAFINPMFTANLASGKLKLYQLCVCSVSYIFMVITYIAIKYTKIPESVFICLFISTLIGVSIRIYVLYRQVGLSPRSYIQEVISKVLIVVFVSVVAPMLIYNNLDYGWERFLLTGFVSVLSVLIAVYFLGINKIERNFVNNKYQLLFKRLK